MKRLGVRFAFSPGPTAVAGVALAVVCSLLVPLPAYASEAPVDEAAPVADVQASSARIPFTRTETGDGRHLAVSTALGVGYHLRGNRDGMTEILAVDLEGGGEVARQKLVPRGYGDPYDNGDNYGSLTLGDEKVVAVDETNARLFVATQTTTPPFSGTSTAAEYVTGTVGPSAGGQFCTQASGSSNASLKCLNGLSVLDARTLALVRHIPLTSLRVDGGPVSPQLAAMSYAPPFEGQDAKVHMVVQDLAGTTASVDKGAPFAGRRQFPVDTYLVQFDVDAGRQDWAVRLDSCRGSRLGNDYPHMLRVGGIQRQAAVFRSRLPGERAIYVACLMNSSALTAGVVRIGLDEGGGAQVGGVETSEPSGPPGSPDPAAGLGWLEAPAVERPITVEGPDQAFEMLADPESGRFVIQVLDGRPLAQVWWVFDTVVGQFIGSIGIGGPVYFGSTLSGLSTDKGRLYVLAVPYSESGRSFEGGLFVADIRRTPLPQALAYPGMAEKAPSGFGVNNYYRWTLSTVALPNGGTRVWYPDHLLPSQQSALIAIDDLRTEPEALPGLDFAGRTLDLPEEDGVTGRAYDAAARGYGFRALLVGFAEAAARMGPVDPVGSVSQCNDTGWGSTGDLVTNFLTPITNTVNGRTTAGGGPCHRLGTYLPTSCTQGDREVVLAVVGPSGPSVVDAAGARGAAQPFTVDSLTLADGKTPASRCAGADWDQVWATALFGRAPTGEPQSPETGELLAECVAPSDQTDERAGDPVLVGYHAEVRCEQEGASGHAYARGASLNGVQVAEALSSFRIYLDPGRGIVSRVESVARGLSLDGLARIDMVRGVAESWANGRQQPLTDDQRDPDYYPNCDMERTAGTCFQRHLFGLHTPGYSCGPCGDEQAFVKGLNAALNPNALVRLREPDVQLRAGSENGFTAAVQKPETERFADLVLNNDLLQTVLPTLEIIRYAAPNRYFSRTGPRGRQIYQFAGVEVSSSYGIACLLVYDEATNTCAGEKQLPGSIQVSLSDTDGKPLAGGAFEVRQDVDADGVLGLKDTLLPDGACVTADDGIGTCTFENLRPGTYLVSQVAAPPGYAKSSEPWVSEVASGEQRTVAFTNVSNVSTIDLKATDEHGAPLSGAAFAAYPDPDSDGKVAPDAKPAAECATDGQGVCTMKVPAGSYVLVQTAVPGGLEGIEPVPFTFASGGQIASVSVVNYPPGAPAQPEGIAAPVYTPPVDVAPPTEIVDDSYVAPSGPVDTVEPPRVSVPRQIAGTVTQVIRAPGDALRLLARDPKQAIAWTAALALFALAAMAVRRRQAALALIRE